jgi:ABC-type dipeptide/oligopeptide/nickel transport system permease subunit
MRETTLGRWMARLAVTVGVSAVALGLSAAAASARTVDAEVASVRFVGFVQAAQPSVDGPQLYATEGFDWM